MVRYFVYSSCCCCCGGGGGLLVLPIIPPNQNKGRKHRLGRNESSLASLRHHYDNYALEACEVRGGASAFIMGLRAGLRRNQWFFFGKRLVGG